MLQALQCVQGIVQAQNESTSARGISNLTDDNRLIHHQQKKEKIIVVENDPK